jgi:flagellar protein FliL
MAEEKEKAEGAEQPKKSKTVIIIVAVVLVLVLAVGGALAFLMLKGGEEGAAGAHGADAAHAKPADKKKAAGAHGANDLTVGPMFAVDGLIINLMSEGGARYAKLAVALELDAQELAPEMLAKKAVVTDIIITVFSSKTAEELMNSKGKESAKNEIMEKVNERLKDGRVKNVYFTNFVVQ